MIGVYIDLIRIRFLMMLAYRVNYYSGILIYVINIGAQYFLWKAIYSGNHSLVGMNMQQMTTYVAVAWMARAFYFNNLDSEIAREIKDGSVAVQFIRPYKYLMVKIMQGMGEGIFRFLLFSLPGMLIVYWLFPVHLPMDPVIWLVFFSMLLLSYLINTQINILTGLFAFFVENNEGMIQMKQVVVNLFSGLVVPIAFFPGWTQTVMQWLPFQAISYLPSAVFVGKVSGAAAVQGVFIVQILWFLLLIVPIYFIWRRARLRLFVQGG